MTFMVKFNRLIKPTLGQDRDLCYTRDRHAIWALSRTVPARWFYCSMNPSRHQELYLLLRTPCCARTHSIAIDLITSKVRYSLRFTAELFTSGLRASVTHARYANSTSQTVRQMQVHSESSAGRTTGSWYPGSTHMRDTLPSPPGTGFQNTAVSPKLQGNTWDRNHRTDS